MNHRGLTLIEILIAVSLVSIVLAAVYTTMFMVQKATKTYRTYGQRLHEARTMLGTLSKEIKSLIYYPKDRRTDFILKDRDIFGKRTSVIEFTTVSSPGGPYRVRYYATEKDDSIVLHKSFYTFSGEEADVVVCENIESFSIRVYDGKKWYNLWRTEDTDSLPEKIEITLAIRLNDSITVFTKTVNPKIEVLR